MSYAYLQDGLCEADGVRDFEAHVDGVARAWLAVRVDATVVEMAAELCARIAKELGDATITPEQLVAGTAQLSLGPEPTTLLRALPKSLAARDVFALAIHLVDLAERMALLTYLPELPAMTTQALRTGDAARNVGLARHLKG